MSKSFLGVVRHRPGFRRIWFSQIVSQLGDWLNRVAVLTLIGRLGSKEAVVGTGALFALELASRLLPITAVGPLAGPIADRLPRRALMIGADLARAALVLCLLFVREPGDLPLLYTVLVLQMALSMFFESARSASIPNVVEKDELQDAYTLSAATWSTMLSVGALSGGLLVAWIGVRGVFVVDALSYLVSAALLLRLRLPPVPKHAEPFRPGDVLLLRDLRRGLNHARELGITPALFVKSLWGGAGGYLVLLSIAGSTRFASTTADAAGAGVAIGALYGARGIGTGIGPVIARFVAGRSDAALRWQIAVGFLVGAAGYACFALCESLLLAWTFVLVAHAGGSTIWVASTTLWQKHVDDAYRGRVYALEMLGMTLSFTLGGFLAGRVYDVTGELTTTTWTSCAVVLAGGVAWVFLARAARPVEAQKEK